MTERGTAPGVLSLLDLAAGLLIDRDVDVVLGQVLEAARELTGARYAALGVLDRSGSELDRFLTLGMDKQTRLRIGVLPRGRGVLGELISNPVPLRLADVGSHPRSYGIPTGHPDMKTFLGVPVFVGDRPFGNLYLTEKLGGEAFTDGDEQTAVRLAEIAGIAIDHARGYGRVQVHRVELQRTLRALDATVHLAKMVSGATDLGRILESVARRGRVLVCARAVVIELEEHGEMLAAAGAGELPDGIIGKSVAMRDSLAATALRTAETLRLERDANRARFERHGLGNVGFRAEAALVVPLVFHGKGFGVLVAVDRQIDGPSFTDGDQRLLEAFAASAATAIASARYVEDERRNQRLAAAERERGRWARELHDGTLQKLAALRIVLSGQLRTGDPDTIEPVLRDAVAELDSEIANLRAVISGLSPTELPR